MEFSIAWRNVWRNKRRTFVIITAIFTGVLSMVVLASLVRGMMDEMVENALGEMTGHIKIQNSLFREDPSIENLITSPDEVLSKLKKIIPKDSKLTKRVILDAVINTARENSGVKLCAVNYKDEIGVSFIGNAKIKGKVFSSEDSSAALIGAAMAEKLGTGLNKKILVSTQDQNGEISSRSFRIKGIFTTDMKAREKAYIFISHKGAEKLLGLSGELTGISIKFPVKDIIRADLVKVNDEITQAINKNLKSETWKELLPAVDSYLAIFEPFLLIWYLVIFIAMGFGIVNTVLMAVFERMREFGLLKAIGMKPFKIFNMVVIETFFLLVMGILAGNAAGFSVLFILSKTGIDLSAFSSGSEMFGLGRVIFPIVELKDIIIANSVVAALGLAVGIYPALKAAGFTPVEAMKID